MSHYTLANGKHIPEIGYGMWKNKNVEEALETIQHAVKTGFRQFDGATAYKNEDLLGDGLRAAGIERKELFITSKLQNKAHGYENVKREVEKTLELIGTDYLDLYLIHWPVVKGHGENWAQDNLDTWKAMEELYEQGTLKAIGVSNFSVEHLENLVKNAKVAPMVNQILFHPGVTQKELVDYCKKNDILVQAYSPLKPLGVLKEDATVQEMCEKYGKTTAQLLLRFVVDNGIIPLTKSVHTERIAENFDLFDFELDKEDRAYLMNWTHPDFTEPDNKNERPPQVS